MTAKAAIALLMIAAVVCVLSPLTLWFAIALVAIVGLLVRGLEPAERRWIVAIVSIAIALRLAAIAGLFITADHQHVPFASFFGDEDYFIKRSLWLRNVALGLNVHRLDLEYAFEPNGGSSYLYALAAIQTITGPAPYGLHLVSVALYVAASLLLYRLVRRSFGRSASLFGLVVLLFLPSLFAWSIAVLKEPPFVLLTAAALTLAVSIVRTSSWRMRAAATLGLLAVAAVLQTVRAGGGTFVLAATVAGLTLGFIVARPRLVIAATIAVPILAALVLRLPEVQLRAYVALEGAARRHWGAVAVSPGVSYKLLDDRFYGDVDELSDLHAGDAARYLARGAAAFSVLPLPWQVRSRAAAAYIPEQVVWYVVAPLAIIGLVSAFRRDPHLAGLLISYAGLIAVAAALTDGNVGTLVRHRGLTLPYLIWFGGLGGCELLIRAETRWL